MAKQRNRLCQYADNPNERSCTDPYHRAMLRFAQVAFEAIEAAEALLALPMDGKLPRRRKPVVVPNGFDGIYEDVRVALWLLRTVYEFIHNDLASCQSFDTETLPRIDYHARPW